MGRLELLVAAVALVLLVSIWLRTCALNARLRSIARALVDVSGALAHLVDSREHTAADMGRVEGAQRAVRTAQEVLAQVIGGSEGQEIEVHAQMPSPGSGAAPTPDAERADAGRSAATRLPDRGAEGEGRRSGASGHDPALPYRSAGT